MRFSDGLLAATLAAVLLAGAAPALAAPCRGCARAGAATVVLHVPDGTPLAGYGALARRLFPDVLGRHPHAFWFKPHDGQLDPLHARALVVDDGHARLVWVTADLVGVDRTFTAAVRARLADAGLRPDALLVSASHTHSGPGAFVDSRVMAPVAVDRADPVVREAVITAVMEAVQRADAAKTEARIGAASVVGPPVVKDRLGQPLDRELLVLKLASAATARPVAVLWNFAIHGTMLGPSNLRLSGDVMGLASDAIEHALGAPALFVNGAEGDVSPAGHGFAAARAAAAELASAVERAARTIDAAQPASFAVTRQTVALAAPALSLKSCVGRWLPSALALPMSRAFPEDAEVLAGRLGATAWVTVPGELEAHLGLALKRAIVARWPHVVVAGLTNDYLGYFLAPAESGRSTYEACASLYGPHAGERLSRVGVDLLRRLDVARTAER